MGEPPKGCLRGRVEEVFRRGNAQAEVLKSKWGLADSVVGDSRQKKEHKGYFQTLSSLVQSEGYNSSF